MRFSNQGTWPTIVHQTGDLHALDKARAAKRIDVIHRSRTSSCGTDNLPDENV